MHCRGPRPDAPRFSGHLEARQSAGVSFAWFTPFLGLLEVSYSFPLNSKLGDDTERFQITLAYAFKASRASTRLSSLQVRYVPTGATVRLSDFRGVRPVALIFGSYT